ncbi:MAG: carbohydrate ABC transporter substrate-binding protein, partial [Acidimicrobiia bacterium]
YYDSWVAGDTPFSDPAMQDIWTTILDLWNTPGAVFAAGGTIAATAFGANGDPLVNGDCLMHRQASFFSAFFPEGTPVADGSDGAVDVFYFPPVGDERPVLGAGTAAVAFRDAPEVWAVMEYMATPEFANLRQTAQAEILGGGGVNSGFLSAAQGVDLSLWNDFEQNLISILLNADVFRFDGSDLMPAAVGAGSFWSEGTSAVNGDKSVEEATAAIDATWP